MRMRISRCSGCRSFYRELLRVMMRRNGSRTATGAAAALLNDNRWWRTDRQWCNILIIVIVCCATTRRCCEINGTVNVTECTRSQLLLNLIIVLDDGTRG